MLTYLLVIGLSIFLTACYFLLSYRRRTPRYRLNPDGLPEVADCVVNFAGLTKSSVHHGNHVEVFQNGDLFPELLNSIRSARDTIHFETFVWNKGEIENAFVMAFSEMARSGIKVRVLIDAIGGHSHTPERLQYMRDAGVQVEEYCKARWWNLHRYNHRTHRKLLVIDGHTGFTFGHGIADQWLGNGEDDQHWRDTGIKIQGPAVFSMQAVFMENWLEETDKVPIEPSCFPELEPVGNTTAHIVSSATGDAISAVALLYSLAIASAQKSVYIQNPYFAPEKNMVDLLCKMVARGVEVHLMVPGKKTDNPFVRRAGCSLYRKLLECGVRVYEFKPTLLHQKIVIVDEKWTHVGSTNFDARSLALNEEAGIGILDEKIAQELMQAFREDLKRCEEIHLEEWKKRPLYDRLFDSFAYLLRHQL